MNLILPCLACAACYGQSDSVLAAGMNWGIMSLLGVIGVVLCGITSFFVFLVKKTSDAPQVQPPTTAPRASVGQPPPPSDIHH